jgi:hypothetical protein
MRRILLRSLSLDAFAAALEKSGSGNIPPRPTFSQ